MMSSTQHCAGPATLKDAPADSALRAKVDAIYRSEPRRVFATQVRLLNDFDLAEETLHDAFRAALEQMAP